MPWLIVKSGRWGGGVEGKIYGVGRYWVSAATADLAESHVWCEIDRTSPPPSDTDSAVQPEPTPPLHAGLLTAEDLGLKKPEEESAPVADEPAQQQFVEEERAAESTAASSTPPTEPSPSEKPTPTSAEESRPRPRQPRRQE